MGLFASVGYLRDRPPPAAPRDLAAHDWLAYSEEPTKVPAFAWLRRHVPPAREVLHATTTTTLVQACAAGLGIAALLVRVGEADPRLVRVLPQADIPARDAWLVYHQDERANARVRAVVAWLREVLG
jgi:DNA-binding transcriptional LysR family regulator